MLEETAAVLQSGKRSMLLIFPTFLNHISIEQTLMCKQSQQIAGLYCWAFEVFSCLNGDVCGCRLREQLWAHS